jgi:hypothetical protein
MREFIEDALSHSDDGLGRAQKPARAQLPKRFYKATGVGVVDGGFTVTLDGRATRTPGRVPVVVPAAGIATIMAAQWAAQGDVIDAETMPMVRLVNAALESGADAAPASAPRSSNMPATTCCSIAPTLRANSSPCRRNFGMARSSSSPAISASASSRPSASCIRNSLPQRSPS